MSAPAKSTPYFSNGQALSSPPLTARLHNYASSTYAFLGLYLATLLSLDSTAAAEASSFNIRNRNQPSRSSGRSGWGGSGGSGGGPSGGGGGGRKMGGVDDIRGPECKSCQ